jgi:hypothetical protein
MLLKKETSLFILGISIGFYAYQCYYQSQPQSQKKVFVPLSTKPKVPILKDTSLYDESLAGEMYKKENPLYGRDDASKPQNKSPTCQRYLGTKM